MDDQWDRQEMERQLKEMREQNEKLVQENKKLSAGASAQSVQKIEHSSEIILQRRLVRSAQTALKQ